MLTLFTDTDTDITPEVAKRYGYNLISMPYIVDGKEIFPYESFDTFDYHAFYQSLRDGVLPSTCALSPQKYIDYFEGEFAKGNDILYVHFSSAMSGTFNAMYLALEELKEKYPERKLYTIDTKGITIGSYNIVCEVGKLYKEGKSIQEILSWADKEVDNFAIYFYADDLKFFKRSGRVSGLAAFFGSIIGVKPIIHMNQEGKMVTYGKGRGRKQTLAQIIDIVAKLQEDIASYTVVIGHSDALPIAEMAAEMLQNRFDHKLNIEYVVVNPTAGSHCGPDGVGISFHAKHR